MSISDRYRALADEVSDFVKMQAKKIDEEAEKPLRDALKALRNADEVLGELREGVGEIPRIRLEGQLTPVLLKGHNNLDRSRLDFLEAEDEKTAAAVWDLQQTIYRLLNDL